MSPFSIHSTVTLSLSSFKEVTMAWCIRPVRNPTALSKKDKWKTFIHVFWNSKQVWVDLGEVTYKTATKNLILVTLQKLCSSTTEKSQSTTVNKQPCFRIYYSELFLLTSPSLQLFNSGISRKKHILSCHKTSYLKHHHATSGQKKSQDPTLSKRY